MTAATAPSGENLGTSRTSARDRWPLWLAGALFGLRLLYSPWINLFPEEAYYWNYAQHLDIGYLDHPPMVAWLIALGTRLFGQTEFGVRVCAFGCSALTSVFAYRLATLLYSRREGALAALLTQALPFFFMSGWMMTPDAPLTACWAGALYFLARVFFADRAWAWLGVGLCLGLGMLSKYTVALVGPAALLFLWLDRPSRRWFRHGAPYAAVALALAVFSPVIYWNMTHHWASFGLQTAGRLHAHRRFSLHELLLAILLLLTPVGLWLAARGWRRSTAGTLASLAGEKRRWRFAWIFTLVPLAVFTVFSVTHRVKLNWTGPLWLALVPLLAAQLAALDPARRVDTLLRAAARVSLAVLAAGYLGLLQYLGFGVPVVRYSKRIVQLPVGWPQVGRELERQQAGAAGGTQNRVLIVGMDQDFIASEAAFYHSRRPASVREVTGAHLFGSKSLMFAYWFPPEAQEGASLVLASFNSHWLDSDKVYGHCDTLEPVQTHAVRLNGRDVCKYYTRVVHGYHSVGPAPAAKHK